MKLSSKQNKIMLNRRSDGTVDDDEEVKGGEKVYSKKERAFIHSQISNRSP
jgi:hypothetical protein